MLTPCMQVYGVHNAAFYIRTTASESSLQSVVHHFLPVDKSSQKIQVGGPGYELVHSASGVVPYLLSLTPENNLEASFAAIAQYEQGLLQPLLSFLTDKRQYERGVRLFGTSTIDLSRVPTVSFVVTGQRAIKSKDVVAEFDKERDVCMVLSVYVRFLICPSRTDRYPLWPFLRIQSHCQCDAQAGSRRWCCTRLSRPLQYGTGS